MITKANNNTVAYFDFDGTLTTRDTLLPFIIYSIGYVRFLWLLPRIAPFVILYILKIINNQKTKQHVLSIVFHNYTQYKLDNLARGFATTELNKYIKSNILEIMQQHLNKHNAVYIVSANLAIYLHYWVEQFATVSVIATELEFDSANRFTGRLATPNCYAEEKTIRINEYLATHNLCYNISYAYGNSAGDYQMLDMCDHGYFVNKCEVTVWHRQK